MYNFDVTWQNFTDSTEIPVSSEYRDFLVTVIPDYNVSAFISWDASEFIPEEPDQEVTYIVYSSFSEQGPFIKLTNQPITDSQYFTKFELNDSKTMEQFYTVEVVLEDGTKFRSYPAYPKNNISKWHQLRHRDIIRREKILLQKFVGVESIVWIPKRHGKRCSVCWDPRLQKVLSDHCEECMGTSFEGGYDTGMLTLLQYAPIDNKLDKNYIGLQENIITSAWTINYPLIPPDSIIARVPDRKIFKVIGNQGSTEMVTTVQRQSFVIQEQGRDSIEYKLFNRDDVIEVMLPTNHIHH